MDLSRLSAPEKLAVYGAIATVIGGVVAAASYPGHWGVTWLAAILGLAMLTVIFLPQLSPDTKLPAKKGSLMVIVGGLAALLMAFVFLTTIGFTFEGFDLSSALFLVAVAGAVVMGLAGWQAFQAEGGTFDIGTAGASAVPPVPMVPPPAPPPTDSPAEAPVGEDDDRA
jgi:hypothetical protein